MKASKSSKPLDLRRVSGLRKEWEKKEAKRASLV